MKRLEIKKLYESFDKFNHPITVCGWIKSIRVSKNLTFIMLNDGSCYKSVQVIVTEESVSNYAEIVKQNVGAALVISATVVVTPNAKQPFELAANEISIEGTSSPDYPLQKKQHTLEFLRTIPHLRPRTNTFSAIYRVRSICAQALHRFFHDNGFVYAHTPIITSNDCEGAGEMFQVTTLDMKNPPLCDNGEIDFSHDFFSKKTSLTVSGQLEGEYMAMGFGKIYTFGPTFRAEKSFTPRHAAEFWMLEPEIAFADLNDNMELAEDMLKYVIEEVLAECPDEMEFFNQFYDKELLERLNNILASEFAKVSYTEAIELLLKADVTFEYPVSWGCDLQTEHERYLTEKVFKKPVFVIDYPKDIKAYYMRMNDDNKTVAAMDLLVPNVGELIGGSQREERLDMLITRMGEMGLSVEDYAWYIDTRKYGSTKHCGFGLGFERLIMYITGTANIRDVLPFPRVTGAG